MVGGDVPEYAREFSEKFSVVKLNNINRVPMTNLMMSEVLMQNQSAKREDQLLEDAAMAVSRPSWPQMRFRMYYNAEDLSNDNAPGKILCSFDKKNISYERNAKKFFHSMKNIKMTPSVLKTGQKYVALGCVDFSQLLFAEFVGDLKLGICFHGVDSAVVSITRCKVLYEMIKNQASARSILQVWFSSGWSDLTLKEFKDACESLIQVGNSLARLEEFYVKFWLSHGVSISDACYEWGGPMEGLKTFLPCGSLRTEVDRINYSRYLMQGIIFDETEESVITGNRTMFLAPLGRDHMKFSGEDFHHCVDFMTVEKQGFVYSGSLKESLDRFMMRRMDNLRGMVQKDQLTMSFENAKMWKGNKDLIGRIKKMNPCIVDWSNLADYCTKQDFMTMAREVSGDETIHSIHFFTWNHRMIGTYITDYDEASWEDILHRALQTRISVHQNFLEASSTYRYMIVALQNI